MDESRTTAVNATAANATVGNTITGNTIVWVKARRSSTQGACVELADLGDGIVGVRDSKDPAGPVLRFTRVEVEAWLDGARNGEFDHLA